MPIYLLARLPAVILLIAAADGVLTVGIALSSGSVLEGARSRAAGVEKPKVDDGVILPLDTDGVARPFEVE